MIKISIIPGINNSGPQHWQTLWEQQYGFARIEQRNWDNPVFKDWKKNLTRAVKNKGTGKNNILITHSLGCLLTVKALPEIKDYISGIFLVAVPDPSTDFFSSEYLRTFRGLPEKNLEVPGYMIYSENDTFSTAAYSVKQGKTWGLRTINAGRKGHINSDSGLGTWKEGYEWFAAFLEEIKSQSCQ